MADNTAETHTETMSDPELRLFRPKSPAAALGLAVSHLMTKPAFAQLKFGHWSRILTGQVNRGHYTFVIDRDDDVVGFLGWALATEGIAEAWVEGRGEFSDEQARSGDCILINAWAADNQKVNRFILNSIRLIGKDKKTVYFKRHYKDGTTRPMRLTVNDFVKGHIDRRSDDGSWPL
ncbi:toxin-activating lysine-acyltransferase [Bauldia sp.]|uniref:toxin-activating lysine-acyltransferase n=1 Tax=Bauldia sp. TaxID=2575872 RepID=UPI003BAC7277